MQTDCDCSGRERSTTLASGRIGGADARRFYSKQAATRMLQSGTEIARIPQRRGATTRLEAQRIPITAQRENEADVARKGQMSSSSARTRQMSSSSARTRQMSSSSARTRQMARERTEIEMRRRHCIERAGIEVEAIDPRALYIGTAVARRSRAFGAVYDTPGLKRRRPRRRNKERLAG